MKAKFIVSSVLLLLIAVPLSAQNLDDILISQGQLSYQGYEVTARFDSKTKDSLAQIRKNGRVLVTLKDGWFLEKSTRIGLFPFLGVNSKQLIVEQYTGGAHCCWIYRIYDLSPRLRVLFDGADYGIDEIGYELHLVDIDGNGIYEFTQAEMAFDYFHMSHASSRFPTIVFAYDRKAKKYRLANRVFSQYVLRGIDEDISEEKKGWAFYDEEYKLDNKAPMRTAIKRQLRSSVMYNAINPRRPRR